MTDDYADLVMEHRMEEVHRAYASKFVDYVLDEATDQGVYDGDQPVDALIDTVTELDAAGYWPVEYEDGERVVKVEAFAGPDAYNAIRDGYDLPVNSDPTDVDQIKIQSITLQLDPSLPDDRLLAIHTKGIVPARPSLWKSWLIKDPEAVQTTRVEQNEDE